jgi:hypothetical protein
VPQRVYPQSPVPEVFALTRLFQSPVTLCKVHPHEDRDYSSSLTPSLAPAYTYTYTYTYTFTYTFTYTSTYTYTSTSTAVSCPSLT